MSKVIASALIPNDERTPSLAIVLDLRLSIHVVTQSGHKLHVSTEFARIMFQIF